MLATSGETERRKPPAAIADVPTGPVGHRPALDGLRAVAVYLVVLFHAGSERFAGGFIGVDVFFVLSGYLVTQVLLRDLAGHGRIRLGRFYARRFRRLLPASVVAIVGTALVVSVVFSPAEVVGALDDFRAALLYWANWFFIRESSDYFGEQVAQSPVLHVWSLAVEEQFYVAWPLLLIGITWLTGRLWPRRRWWATRAIVGGAALASAGWALALSRTDPNRAYYGTDTRAYQLLAGALLALTPGLLVRAGRLGRALGPLTLATMGGLLVLSSWLLVTTPVRRGVLVCALTVALIAGLEQARSGVLARALGTPVLAQLGQISYGTYLWHWPVIVVAERLLDLGPMALAATSAVLATALASLSASLIEQPIRRSALFDRHRLPVIGAGLAISVVAATLVAPAILEPAPRSAEQADISGIDLLTPIPVDFDEIEIKDQRYGTEVLCDRTEAQACTVREGSGPHLFLLGDSNAVMMIEGMEELAEQEDLTLSLGANSGCSWIRGFTRPQDEEARRQSCARYTDDLYDRVIPELDPDLVVALDVREGASLGRPAFGQNVNDERNRDLLGEAVTALTAEGRDLAIIEPFPRSEAAEDPLACLADAGFGEACRFQVSTDPYWFEEEERRLAESSDQVWTIDLDRAACPLWPICDPVIGETIVWWDGAHLTRAFSRSLADDLAAALRDDGLLPAR